MANSNDRWRSDQDRYRYWDDDRERGRYAGESRDYGRGGYGAGRGVDYEREEEGYIARRGFGNERSGYDRDRGYDQWRDYGRERDYGDSAGYGTGGSSRDWRDVMGEDRRYGGWRSGRDYERDRGWAGGHVSGGHYGRYGSSEFGRGSRRDEDERGFFERAGDEIRSWFGDEDAERRREQDTRQDVYGTGSYRGRGPRGYMRSDERIREDVCDRLTDDPVVDASEIEVQVSGSEVTLTGTVDNRESRRRAEDLVERISGVTHVQNNLRVKQPSAAGVTTTGAGSSATPTGSAGPTGTGASGGTGTTMGATTSTGSAGSAMGTNQPGASRRRASTGTGT